MYAKIINGDEERYPSLEIAEDDLLTSIAVSYELMQVPAITFTLPARYGKYLSGNSIIELRTDDFVYVGYVVNKQLDVANYTISVNTSHIVGRLDKRNLPSNVTAKGNTVKDVFDMMWAFWVKKDGVIKDELMALFTYNLIGNEVVEQTVEYEFSHESVLEFLTKICELTDSIYWRINRFNPYQIDVGVFGDKKEVLIDKDNYFISMNSVDEDYSEVMTHAYALSDKSDGGASTLTLRDIFWNHKDWIDPKFPIDIIQDEEARINSQRNKDYPRLIVFAPENETEMYYITDVEGLALERGVSYWGTITNNDVQTIAKDNEALTDDDRLQATYQMYKKAIRKMKNSRRHITYTITTSPLPNRTLNAGDKVMFIADVDLTELSDCSNYYIKLLKENDWFYITRLTSNYEVGNALTMKVELSKALYSDRDTQASE
ncbi:hypothetical protein [Streptococcus hyointestinalis]|uniref:hypothetical protein n=1 Tax=Streptococcus hyointestinalis TaxID=1337 RepID=UPI0013E04466|nr:hypothetical protein [Streptococcus hyointestinalis]